MIFTNSVRCSADVSNLIGRVDRPPVNIAANEPVYRVRFTQGYCPPVPMVSRFRNSSRFSEAMIHNWLPPVYRFRQIYIIYILTVLPRDYNDRELIIHLKKGFMGSCVGLFKVVQGRIGDIFQALSAFFFL